MIRPLTQTLTLIEPNVSCSQVLVASLHMPVDSFPILHTAAEHFSQQSDKRIHQEEMRCDLGAENWWTRRYML